MKKKHYKIKNTVISFEINLTIAMVTCICLIFEHLEHYTVYVKHLSTLIFKSNSIKLSKAIQKWEKNVPLASTFYYAKVHWNL